MGLTHAPKVDTSDFVDTVVEWLRGVGGGERDWFFGGTRSFLASMG